MRLIGQLLCAVPRRIAFPEGTARGGVCQLGQQRRHVPLQILQPDAQQGLHIADRVNRQHILAAYQQAHLVRVAVQLLYHLPDRAASFTHRAPLYFSSPVPVRGGRCQQFWGGIVLSLTPKKARWGRIFPPRCAPRRLAAPDMGVRQEFLPVCCNKQHNRKTPSPGRRGSHRGAYSPALQLATKALAASAAEV